MSHLANRIDGNKDHTDHIASQLGAFIKAHDEMVESHEEQADTIRQLQLKIADLEDRFHRKKY